MKILIDNSGYELKNFGDIAMLVATIERIYELMPDSIIYVFTENPDRLKDICPNVRPVDLTGRNEWFQSWSILGGFHRLCPQAFKEALKNAEFLFKSNFLSLGLFIIKLRMKLRNHNCQNLEDFIKLLKSVDIVMATGGGFVTDDFSIHAKNILRILYIAQKMDKRTAMIGQGLGPISDAALISIANKVFPKLDLVGLREYKYSQNIALSLGVRSDRLTVTGDDAVALAYRKSKNTIGKNIGLNLRVAKYSNLSSDSSEKVKKLVMLLAQKEKGQIVPIAISIHDGDSDIKTLANILGSKINDSSNFSLNSVIENIGQCKLVITGSYHAGVFALSQGIPVIGVAASDYYRQKFEGLRGQFDPSSCFILDMDDSIDLNEFEKIATNLIENVDKKRSELLFKAKEQIKKSDQIVKALIKLV